MFFKRGKKIKIAIVGNCQARPIGEILPTLNADISVTVIGIVHLLKDNEKDIYYKQFEDSDYIFTQRVSDNYPCKFIRTIALKSKWNKKVIVWPNMFFQGYNPELFYIRIPGKGTLRGPLGDYHNKSIVYAWKRGYSVDEAIQLHSSIEFNQKHYAHVPRRSLDELQRRENDCDITITDFLENILYKQRLFFTFNHPKMMLLYYIAESFLNRFVGKAYSTILRKEWEPLGSIIPPLNPWIAEKYNLCSKDPACWKGMRVESIGADSIVLNGFRDYNDEEIVREFFKIYSVNDKLLSDISIS